MKNFNNKISNLASQISLLDNMIMLHNEIQDEIMVQQYRARKTDYLKELLTELLNLNASSPRIHEIIKSIISKLEAINPVVNEQEISQKFKFSLTELEAAIEG
ncbi:MAG: hypothetical protein NT004_08780 [Bacteroidetes bacterium]|nr:hypothetical protein [Bacteroidota bacterium]